MRPVTSQTVCPPLVALQLLQAICDLSLNRCGRCKALLHLDDNSFLSECGCLRCKECMDGPDSPFPGWTTRTSSTKREDRTARCDLVKKLGDKLQVCDQLLHSELHILQPTSILLNNARLASVLDLRLRPTTTHDDPSSSSTSSSSSAQPIPFFVPPPPPTTPLVFPATTPREIVRRAALVCMQQLLPDWEARGREVDDDRRRKSSDESHEPTVLEALYSKSPDEWADFYVAETTPKQQAYLMDRHLQNGPQGGPGGLAFWNWLGSYDELIIGKDSNTFGIYEIGALSMPTTPLHYRAPAHPSFGPTSPSHTRALLLPPPSCNLDSDHVPSHYLGSMAKGIPQVRINDQLGKPTAMGAFASCARIGDHLKEIDKASKLLERRSKEQERKKPGWEERIGEINKELDGMTGDVYGRGVGGASAYGIVLMVGGSASLLLRSEWEAIESILMVAVQNYQKPSFVAQGLQHGLLPPNSPRIHTQRLPLSSDHSSETNYVFPVALNRSIPLAVGREVPGGGSRFNQIQRREQRVLLTTLSLLTGSSSRRFRRKETRFSFDVFGVEFWFSSVHPLVLSGAIEGTMLLILQEDRGKPALCDASGYDSFSMEFLLVTDEGALLSGFIQTGTTEDKDRANFLAARKLVLLLRRRIEFSNIVKLVHQQDPDLEISAPFFDPGSHDFVRATSTDREFTERLQWIQMTSIASPGEVF